MKLERFSQKDGSQKGFYISPIIVYSYGSEGIALCFGWLWCIWTLWIFEKKDK